MEAEENLRWARVTSFPHLVDTSRERLVAAWEERAGWRDPAPAGLSDLPGVIPGADETVVGDTFEKIAGWFAENLGAGVTIGAN